jgi:transposase
LIFADRDQPMLLPVDMREWLAEGDLAWVVLDVVGELDLSGFYGRLRSNGQGAAAFDPAMMLALVVYAQALGIRSSRVIERMCRRDVGFRLVSCQLAPDHSTITRFLQRHRQAVVGVFGQVLRLCAEAGMVSLGVIAIDGTKIAANASWAKSYTAAGLAHRIAQEQAAFEQVAGQLLDAQIAVDAAEDAARVADPGDDDLPPQLRTRQQRLARLRAAQDDLNARKVAAQEQMRGEQAARQAEFDRRKQAGEQQLGPRPKDEVAVLQPKSPPRASVTDVDSRRMKGAHGLVQGYNAQLAVTSNQVIVAAVLSQKGTDHHLLPEVLQQLTAALAAAGITEQPGVLVADAQYANEQTFTAVENAGLQLLAPVVSDERYVRGQDPAGARDLVKHPATARAQQRLRGADGRAAYAVRGRSVEPVFGQLKDRQQLRKFSRRGLTAVTAELHLAATAHNITKLWRHRSAATAT